MKTIKLAGDVTTSYIAFTNILDTVSIRDLTKPTKPSPIGVLSHVEGQTN